MTCRHCGKEIPSDAQYCQHCGAEQTQKYRCPHCGKEVSTDANYCPYCAEPKPEPEKPLEEEYIEQVEKEHSRWNKATIIGSIIFCIVCAVLLGPIGIAVGIINFIAMMIYGKAKNQKAKKPGKQFIINAQFAKDQTSICPKCGSHNIKIYRNGYDYGQAFWYRKYGGGYAAGLDSNRARCRCMRCGNDWLTDYDYRLIK